MSCCKKCPYTDKNCIHSLPICKAYEKEYKPLTAIRCKIEVSNEENKIHQTNADRIRSMSDEELAEFLANFAWDNEPTKIETYEWLQSEAEE